MKTEEGDFRCFVCAENGARAKKRKRGVGEGKEYESRRYVVMIKIITILIQMCHIPSWGGGTAIT